MTDQEMTPPETYRLHVRNLLAIIRALATRTAENYTDIDDFSAHFIGRLDAVARAENAFFRGFGERIDLEEVVRDELLAQGADGDRYDVTGPAVWVKSQTARVLALALHELAVNAIKFGALGQADGRLDVQWRFLADGDNALRLEWREHGVHEMASGPTRYGMGRELLERGLNHQIGASTTLQFAPGGVGCVITIPSRNVEPAESEAP